MSRKRISRRVFLGATAAAVAPMVLPQGVLAAPGRPGANDRIVIGQIGTGGMGRYHLGRLRDQIAIICDVDNNQLAEAMKTARPETQTCKDYRRILDRNDLDAVLITAPDHWHGVMAVQACEAGKDVYVEKPSSVTVEEGREPRDTRPRDSRRSAPRSSGAPAEGRARREQQAPSAAAEQPAAVEAAEPAAQPEQQSEQ